MYSSNPITLITGTGRGLGKALAEYYVNKGHYVIGCSRNDIDYQLNNYVHFVADVNDEKSVMNMFRYIKKEFGRLDNLINNAALSCLNYILFTDIKTTQNLSYTNFCGLFTVSREATKLMMKNKYGRIINILSMAVKLKPVAEGVYAASRAAVSFFTEAFAKEVYEYGITVNALSPAPLYEHLLEGLPKEVVDDFIPSKKLIRFGKLEDTTNVIDFFLRKESELVTGHKIFIGTL